MALLLYVAGSAAVLFCALRVVSFSRRAAIALIAFPLLFAGRALLTGGVLGPLDIAYTSEPLASMASVSGMRSVKNPAISDVYSQFMPWRDALRRSIERGEWPLWNPYDLCGMPLAGSAQSAPYHPVTLVSLLLPLRESFALSAALLLMTTATFAFLLFREFVRSEAAALFGAFGWAASTNLVFFLGTALALATSAMPLVLLGARRVACEPSRKSIAILTIALLLVVLAGHPESTLHIVTFGIAYFLFEAAALRDRAAVGRALAAGLASGAIALLLSAIFLLPMFEAIGQAAEYAHRSAALRPWSPTPWQLAHQLAADFFPFREGAAGVEELVHTSKNAHGWLPSAYAGSIVLAPALFALARSRSRQRWFFLGAVVWGLGVGMNARGFTDLLSHLPGFAIAVNDRMISFAALGMCALAAIGIGLDAAEGTLARWFVVVAIVTLAFAVVLPSGIPGNYLRINAARAVLPVALAACALAVFPPRVAAIALIALLALQRGGEDLYLQPTAPARAFYPAFPGLTVMRSTGPVRIVATGTMLTPQTATHYGLEDVRGFEAMTFGRLADTYPLWCAEQMVWFNRVDGLDSPMLSMMNVRYAVLAPDTKLPPWWRMRARFPAYGIAENLRVLPRAFVPRSVRVVRSPGESLAAISTIPDFGEAGVIEDDTASSGANGPGTASVEAIGSHVRLRAHMTGAGWIVVSESAWKGWNARENGRPLPVRTGNHAFLAIRTDAGDHDIELTYRPRTFVAGAWISGLTAVALTLFAFVLRRSKLLASRTPLPTTASAGNSVQAGWERSTSPKTPSSTVPSH